MDDKNKAVDDVQPETKRGSGSILAASRKQQKRTVEEIADELNLSVTQIRTIELDQSEGLPEPTYVRGYIRSYARLLNLDVEDVLEHYLNPNWQKGARLDDMPRDIGSADDSRRGGFFTPFKVIVVLLLLVVLCYLLFSGKLSNFMSSDSLLNRSTQSVPSSPTTKLSEPEVVLSNQDKADASNSAADQQTGDVAEVAVDAVVSLPENTLGLNFSDTSWVDIRDGNGERLAYKSYAQGEILNVSSATTMSVFIGNAKAVSADLNGQPYDISQYREGVFARFTIEGSE